MSRPITTVDVTGKLQAVDIDYGPLFWGRFQVPNDMFDVLPVDDTGITASGLLVSDGTAEIRSGPSCPS